MTTQAEKKHMSWVASLGCLICGRPAELHHPRFSVGMSQRESNYLTIPLCESHHRLNNYGHAVHSGQQEFEQNYLSETEMLAKVIKELARRVK